MKGAGEKHPNSFFDEYELGISLESPENVVSITVLKISKKALDPEIIAKKEKVYRGKVTHFSSILGKNIRSSKPLFIGSFFCKQLIESELWTNDKSELGHVTQCLHFVGDIYGELVQFSPAPTQFSSFFTQSLWI